MCSGEPPQRKAKMDVKQLLFSSEVEPPDPLELKSQLHFKFPDTDPIVLQRGTAEFSQFIVFRIPVCNETEETGDMER